MRALVTALYAEGPSDERFLPVLIQRTAATILAERSAHAVEVLEPMLVTPQERHTQAENILAVARQVHGYHILFVHADADAPSRATTFQQRFEPGLRQVQNAHHNGDPVCADLVPVIPVQMREAWLLADPQALIDVIGTNLSADVLGIPRYSHQIEGLADPKQRLTDIIRHAFAQRSRRRRRWTIREFDEPLAQQIALAQLQRLPSYQDFVADLTAALVRQNFCQE